MTGRHVLPGVVDAARPPRRGHHAPAHDPRTPPGDRGGRRRRRHLDARRVPDVAPSRTTRSSRSPARRWRPTRCIDFGFHFCIGTREQLEAVPRYVAELGVSSLQVLHELPGDEGERPRPARQRRRLPARAARGGRGERRDGQPARREHRARQAAAPGAACSDGRRARWTPGTAAARTTSRPRPSSASAFLAAARRRRRPTPCTSQRAVARTRCASSARRHPDVFVETCTALPDARRRQRRRHLRQGEPAAASARRPRGAVGGVADGSVDTIGSDHVAAAPAASRRRTSGQGLRRLPRRRQRCCRSMLSEGHCGAGLPLERLVDRSRRARARSCSGSAPARASIRAGADADLVVRGPDRRRHDRRRRPSCRRRLTRRGRACAGEARVEHTLLRGRRSTPCGDGRSPAIPAAATCPRHSGSDAWPPRPEEEPPHDRARPTARGPTSISADDEEPLRARRIRQARRASATRPALLIIDVQYRTIGDTPEAVLRVARGVHDELRRGGLGRGRPHRRSCSRRSARRACRCSIRTSRRSSPTTAADARREGAGDHGRARPRLRVRRRGGAAADGDLLLPKKHPSAFFGTPLASYLIEPRRRHARGHRLHDQRLRARQRSSTRSPTTSACVVPARRGLRPHADRAPGQPLRHGAEVRGRDDDGRGRRSPDVRGVVPVEPFAPDERVRRRERGVARDLLGAVRKVIVPWRDRGWRSARASPSGCAATRSARAPGPGRCGRPRGRRPAPRRPRRPGPRPGRRTGTSDVRRRPAVRLAHGSSVRGACGPTAPSAPACRRPG